MLRRALALLTIAGGLALPALARAGGQDVIRDCERHGTVTGHYTQKELSDALKNLPTDDREYTNCEEAIQQAQTAAAGSTKRAGSSGSGGAGGSSGSSGSNGSGASGGSGGGSPGGATASTPDAHQGPAPNAGSHAPGSGPIASVATRTPNAGDAAALKAAQQGLARDGGVLAADVRPGDTSSAGDGGLGSLPVPVLVVVILLLAGALVSLAVAARRTPWVGRVLARPRG